MASPLDVARRAIRPSAVEAVLQMPNHILALADDPRAGQPRPPCPIDPGCRVDHLTRKKRRRRG